MSATNAFAGSWASLPTSLTPWIFDVIQAMGHTQMTPVQASTIPLFMKNKDVVVEAVTGSGKTLAFVIPILERLVRREHKLKHNEIGALIISPTRELANQIHSVFSLFLSAQPIHKSAMKTDEPSSLEEQQHPEALLLVSSDQSSPGDDVQRFLTTRADIVIGTPGRIEEFLLGRGKSIVSVKELEVLVLDEADRLLDLGFQATITRILIHLPKQRRTGLFSATMTDADALSELVRVSLRNPARIVVKVQSKKVVGTGEKQKISVIEEQRIPANLQNYYISCRPAEKLVQTTRIISHDISQHGSSQFIIYFSTCACVDYFFRILKPLLPPSTTIFSLHGHLPPGVRTKTLSSFTNNLSTPTSPSILLATDVAARGLDLPHVDVVIQFDPPSDPKAFSHRCGRTARAGRSGRAYVLLCGRETEYVDFMAIRKIPMKEHPYIRDVSDMSDYPTLLDRPLDHAVADFLIKIRKIVLTDRGINDKAAKAFVSFARSYSKHEASYIFRTKDLDLVSLGACFGLLRLPKMPELKGKSREGWKDADVGWDKYAYADSAQESKRVAAAEVKATKIRENEEAGREAQQPTRKASKTAWSQHSDKRDERDRRREKKDKKKEWLKTQLPDVSDLGFKRARVASDDEATDWKEIAREEQLAKKVRRGNISQQTFNTEFAGL